METMGLKTESQTLVTGRPSISMSLRLDYKSASSTIQLTHYALVPTVRDLTTKNLHICISDRQLLLFHPLTYKIHS